MKKLVCLFINTSPDVYFRDMFLVPYYIGLLNNYEVSYVYHGRKNEYSYVYRGVKMIPLHYKGRYNTFSFRSEWYFFWYVLKNARKIDCLVRFHFSYQTAIIGWIYKLINPHGIFYIKGDGYGLWLALFREKAWFQSDLNRDQQSLCVKLKNKIIHQVLCSMCKSADRISVELPEIYEYLLSDSFFKRYPDKLKLMFNGIDERALITYQIKELGVSEKENLILSVGRHGSWPKNTTMFLRALSLLDLKGWKVLFIGTIEKGECQFQHEIDGFFKENPMLTENVKFIGPIYDQKQLYEYYNRAKVFVHTSLYESFGIVLGEAFRFKNYLISTPVGIAPTLVRHGYGKLCEHNNADMLATLLQEVIDGKIDLECQFEQVKVPYKMYSWENEISKLGNFEI